MPSSRSLAKIAGSESGSTTQSHGSADSDLDPHQHFIYPEHWFSLCTDHFRMTVCNYIAFHSQNLITDAWSGISPPPTVRYLSMTRTYRSSSLLYGTSVVRWDLGWMVLRLFVGCNDVHQHWKLISPGRADGWATLKVNRHFYLKRSLMMNIKFVFALCFKFYFASTTVVPWKSLR